MLQAESQAAASFEMDNPVGESFETDNPGMSKPEAKPEDEAASPKTEYERLQMEKESKLSSVVGNCSAGTPGWRKLISRPMVELVNYLRIAMLCFDCCPSR